ncbi:AAA family ATPase [Lysobacter sp. BMK333-48F3]|uniref:AAA family ATPase n=1 Tax=Lysobacter sp. BMK333-48F3 TaxID=2867962 RepID=UPI001C8C66FE|nr:AAA family ATPase [Lysobacter sp. BMK333-48F3]
MDSPPFYVITGASGAGKSTLLAALAELGYATVPEVARALVQEQKACNGHLLPSTDRAAFMRELLARNIQAHQAAQSLKPPVFFDRGIPECLAWLDLMDLPIAPEQRTAAARHRYAGTVFVAEPWPQIYVHDSERHASFERASRSYPATVAAYVEAGYRTCILPKTSVQERAGFVLAQMAAGV